jgi:hypothetical protein
MERELWPALYRLIREAGADFSQKYAQHTPRAIVAVLCWSALHDRPRYWACDSRNWNTTTLRPTSLPSPSAGARVRWLSGCSSAPWKTACVAPHRLR